VSSAQWAALAFVAVLVFWMLGGYNRLMRLRNRIGEAFTRLDEALARRLQAVPPLAAALQEKLPGEQASLDALLAALAQHEAAVAAARSHVTSPAAMSRLLAAEGELASALLRVQALLDRRGDVASLADVSAPLAAVHEADARITFTRQLFNDAVLAYNDARSLFPTSLLARLYRLDAAAAL
jgi:LemA protein